MEEVQAMAKEGLRIMEEVLTMVKEVHRITAQDLTLAREVLHIMVEEVRTQQCPALALEALGRRLGFQLVA